MTIRRLLRWSLILVIVAAFAVWLEPTRVVWGWLRGEAFYQGRPTSWWARNLDRYEIEMMPHGAVISLDPHDIENRTRYLHIYYRRNRSELERLYETVTGKCVGTSWTRVDQLPLHQGDNAAEPVLRALADYPSRKLQLMANHGLGLLEQKQTER
jgi:hypothetical protein